ncbi:hypothetical protein [Cellulomonas carbonis]|uniref:Carboxypeptidase regulatory-like domain-containing protein n=1 Tax=Cellulomonas carbonis T26 TaxID=947969 RepID=A0A0A0BME3_9CELL|nr:hypothetical protein [Cellulomonas carbonis]KGM08872.1 hypothetical protein N868_05870 [Cellulomonas carbonis T26]GGC08909.1 hypothetical protein GCM10010972_22760 [Cellulomonas carbonis]
MTDDADEALLAPLRAMWRRRDPVPDGLVTSVLVALASEGLDEEYELLTLTGDAARLEGVRAPAGDDGGAGAPRTLTFTAGPVTVMLRVSPLDHGRRRVDGWVSPAGVHAVRLRCGADDVRTTSSAAGRFEVADVPSGVATLWVLGPEDAGTPSVRVTTAPFEL